MFCRHQRQGTQFITQCQIYPAGCHGAVKGAGCRISALFEFVFLVTICHQNTSHLKNSHKMFSLVRYLIKEFPKHDVESEMPTITFPMYLLSCEDDDVSLDKSSNDLSFETEAALDFIEDQDNGKKGLRYFGANLRYFRPIPVCSHTFRYFGTDPCPTKGFRMKYNYLSNTKYVFKLLIFYLPVFYYYMNYSYALK